MQDVRWLQRFDNFKKALSKLKEAVNEWLEIGDKMTDLELEGMVQRFEFTYELAWNTIKDFYENQGESGIQGSRDAFKMATQRGLIQDGKVWMEMIEVRKLTVHTYDESITKNVTMKIKNEFMQAFIQLESVLQHASKQ
jgi:nucleotidyltransferase substrate binding protein (TIGR01987 family)